ncbi:Shedu immune nuclease family protein [Paenibacillus ehimensis]|uniref:Shedu immune nuclease family protein n=1 Tax=Paenibacillus ehimensis TaxID=79264 RepID=UPI00046EEDC0|nr:Shedu immune nuclease family protein [Paenibacillus ehimensis]
MTQLNIQKIISKELSPDYFSDKFFLRVHQMEAMRSIQEALSKGKTKLLLQMVVGAGKTILALAIAKLFLKEGNAKKILYLSNLETIQEHIMNVWHENMRSISYPNINNDENWYNNHLNFLTYRQMLQNDRLIETYFDLVICDDIENLSVQIEDCIENFSGYIIGFSTPRKQIYSDINFKADLVFKYALNDAINDGVLIDLGNKFTFFSSISDEINLKIQSLKQSLSNESNPFSSIDDVLSSLNVINDELREDQEMFKEFIKKTIKITDITTLAFKKQQLDMFSKLLNDEVFLKEAKNQHHNSSEKVWQTFFENNTWIFGYGLNYIFGSPLENEKFEQAISGYNFAESGKKVDALMKTRGKINSMCFVEMKTHLTPLLDSQYRNGCWTISKELSGAIAQIQNYKYKAIKQLSSKIEIKSKSGEPTGEIIYNYNPKSIILIGNLDEFNTPHGVNEDKLSSFEIFRKSIEGIEIITFDELFERARCIIEE